MDQKRASNQEVRKINRLNTIRSILACERISQRELAQKLDVSWPTVLQNVKELAALGLVQEVGSFESTGGRKAKALAPNRDAHLAVGLDITQKHIGLVLTNLSGDLIQYTRKKLAFSLEEAYFQTVASEILAFVASANYPKERILGLGVSLPGIVDVKADILTYSHALDLRDTPLEEFRRHMPFPCVFINDANAAGFAELRGQDGPRSTLYLSLSNSVGGAILTGGQLYTGNHLRAGEFGLTTLIPDGRPCYCGKLGCVDSYCSAKRLAELANGSLELFFDRLRAGDPEIKTAWLEYLNWLAIVVNNLEMSFDCDVIVGGYVGSFLGEHVQLFRSILAARNTFDQNADYFKPCKYKYEAAALGASLLQIENFLESL